MIQWFISWCGKLTDFLKLNVEDGEDSGLLLKPLNLKTPVTFCHSNKEKSPVSLRMRNIDISETDLIFLLRCSNGFVHELFFSFSFSKKRFQVLEQFRWPCSSVGKVLDTFSCEKTCKKNDWCSFPDSRNLSESGSDIDRNLELTLFSYSFSEIFPEFSK